MRTVRASVDEFWSYVVERSVPLTANYTPCWEWNGSKAYNGYYAFRSVLAHRAAATIYCGKIPSSVTQRCGNKKCVRPEHFFISMPIDESKDFVPVHKQPEIIKTILDARGEGRYTIEELVTRTKHKAVTIRKVLRESPLYDLVVDIENRKKREQPIPMKPTRKESNAKAV